MRGALDGVKVLDRCIILARPTCGRTLAEFGADVIKVDDPKRGALVYHNEVNRGKRSILLDLKTPAGVEVFRRLVDDAGVVGENFRAVPDGVGRRVPASSARRIDPHHIGALIGEQHAGQRPSYVLPEVDHMGAVDCSGHGALLASRSS